jgi:serine protease inhibitor
MVGLASELAKRHLAPWFPMLSAAFEENLNRTVLVRRQCFWIRSGAPSGFHVRADHPFLCAIRDSETGEVLFLGAIYDPAKV